MREHQANYTSRHPALPLSLLLLLLRLVQGDRHVEVVALAIEDADEGGQLGLFDGDPSLPSGLVEPCLAAVILVERDVQANCILAAVVQVQLVRLVGDATSFDAVVLVVHGVRRDLDVGVASAGTGGVIARVVVVDQEGTTGDH